MNKLSNWNNNDLLSVRDFMDRVFEDFSSNFSLDTANRPALAKPAIDIIDHDDHVEVRADMPGIAPEHVNIEFNDGTLTISATIERDDTQEGDNYTRRERYMGSYRRSLTIPNSLDAGNATAEFEHGVLSLSIPRREEAKPVRIPVGKGKALKNGK